MPHIDKWKIKKGTKFPVDKDAKSRSQIEKELYDVSDKELSGGYKSHGVDLSEMSWEELVQQATIYDISINKSQKTEREGPRKNPFRFKDRLM